MSKIDKWYFKLNPSALNTGISFSDSKENLIQSGLISKIWDSDSKKFIFTGKNGTPWRIGFNPDEQVSAIWFNRESHFQIDNVNFCCAKYPDLILILERYFVDITDEIKSMGENWSYEESDILCIICRDFFVTLIALLKTSPRTKDENNI